MPQLRTEEVARCVAGALVVGEHSTATGLVADSRLVRRGMAFAAIRGGHAFVADALRAGAPFVVVERDDVVPDGATAVVVDDVVASLGSLAQAVRERLDLRVVAITGSVGKTLTKDFIAAALRTSLRTHAAPASYNAEIGVPLTLLGCADDTEVLVCEVAARRPGEIEQLAGIIRPHIGVVTGIGTAHLELFGSREAIARTKSELLAPLPPDGLAVVPSNDDFLSMLSSATSARLSTVGPGGHIRHSADRITSDGRTHGRIGVGDVEIEVVLPVPGRALMRNAALAIRVVVECGADPREAAGALADAPLSSWRVQIGTVDGRTIVNDAWNAGPASMAATLRAVRELAGSRETWAVLGRMAELGPTAPAEHRRVGRLAAALGYTGVIVVGEGAQDGAERLPEQDGAERLPGQDGAERLPMTEEIVAGAPGIAVGVGSLAEAAEAVRQRVPPGAVVVVKASRAVGLERLVEELQAAGADTGWSVATPSDQVV